MNDSWHTLHAEKLLSELKASGIYVSTSVESALLKVPRHAFLDKVFIMSNHDGMEWLPYSLNYARECDRRLVYRDELFVVQLRDGIPSIVCTSPGVMVNHLDSLHLREGMKFLEIGAGTGYSAALASEIAKDPALVTSVEIDGGFARLAKENLSAVQMGEVTVVEGDGTYGYEPNAPYERILVNSSCRFIPEYWLQQLSPGGTLLAMRKDSHTQQLLRLTSIDGLLTGPSLGFSAFPELNHKENEPVALLSFPSPTLNFQFDSLMTVSPEERAAFQLLADDDFCFFMQLQQPRLHALDMIVSESMAGEKWRPVIIDATTNEAILVGPTYEDGPHSRETYGEPGILALVLSVCREWEELGRPRISDYWFTALLPSHSRLKRTNQTMLNGRFWHMRSPAPDYLDWVIELRA